MPANGQDALKKLEELRGSGHKIQIVDVQDVLSSSPEWWRVILETAGLAMAVGDMEGNVLAVSPSFQTVFGYSQDEINEVGGVAGMTHPDDLPLDEALFGELLRGERDHYQLEKRYLHRDGREMWGRLTVLLLRSDDSGSTFVVAIVQDITETKEAQEAADAIKTAILRHDQALELNDSVVQGLVVTKMALESGLEDKAKESLELTLERARATVSELLGSMAQPPGSLRRPE